MSGELEDTQLVSCRLPNGRGKRREGTELEMPEVLGVAELVLKVGLGSLWVRGARSGTGWL